MRAEHLAWLLLVLGPVAPAADWAALSASQRALLAPFEAVWPTLPAPQQQQIVANADRWQQLDPARQTAVLQRLQQWRALPAARRQQIRFGFAQFRALPESRQQALQQAFARFAQLPPARQAEQRQAFAELPPTVREPWRLPDAERALHLLAGRVFPFVPTEQQQATLDMLAALDDNARQALDRSVHRLPPWQREVLRVELLASAPDRRAALLDQRLRY